MKRGKHILFICELMLLTFFWGVSCSPFSGKYCFSSDWGLECVDFKKKGNFEYTSWIDVGSDKGFGKFEIRDSFVILNFSRPPFRQRENVIIKIYELNKEELIFEAKNEASNTSTEKSILVQCIDQQTKKPIRKGTVTCESINGVYVGGGENYSGDTIRLDLKYIDDTYFPIKLKLSFWEYLDYEVTIFKKEQYFILAELVHNQGYNLTKGSKRFKIDQFVSKSEHHGSGLNKRIFTRVK